MIDTTCRSTLSLNQTGKRLGSLKAENKRILLKSGLYVYYLDPFKFEYSTSGLLLNFSK